MLRSGLARSFRALTMAFAAAASMLIAVPSASAIVAFNATGSSPNGNNFAGLRLGNEFSVGGNGITITALGVYDANANGLAAAHDVRLFRVTSDNVGVELGSVNVPAGTGATLDGLGSGSGFRYVNLVNPIFIPAGTRGSVVAYGLFGTTGADDTYGDGAGDPTGNVTWFGHNRYDFNAGNTGLPTYRGGDGNRHAAASFIYINGAIVPEPGTAALALMGVTGLVLRRRRMA